MFDLFGVVDVPIALELELYGCLEKGTVCFTSSTFLCLVQMDLYSLKRRRLISIGIYIINPRRCDDRLRFIKGIPIP